MAESILFTGGLGFLGRHTVLALAEAGYEVTVIDLPSSSPPSSPFKHARVRIHAGDFRNSEEVRALCRQHRTAVHFAWTSLPATAQSNPAADLTDNIGPSAQFFETAYQGGIRNVLFASSGGTVYGDYRRPVTERDLPQPIGAYGLAKLTTEHFLRMACTKYAGRGVALRFANPFGRDVDHAQGAQGLLDVFLSRIAQGLPVRVFGDGSVVRDFFHVSDLAAAVVAVARMQEPGFEAFNVGSGQGRSVKEILALVENVVGRKLVIQYEPSRGFDVPVNILDTTKLHGATGWKPELSLPDGIRKVWEARS